MSIPKPVAGKQVVCMKWGAAYGANYVNILYAMVARNITGNFRFYCFTDDASGIREEVVCLPLPELGCEIPPGTWGKWKKSALWARELPGGVRGVVLFIDLDSVIVGNIDDYFSHGEPDDVILARNWVKPLRRLGQTSVFRFKVGSHPCMLDNLRADPDGISKKYQFEQHYVTHGIKGGVKFWPSKWTRHFRVHCLPPWPLRYLMRPRFPKDAKIITCPGGPNPAEIVEGKWHPGDARRTVREHIGHVWRCRKKPGFRWMRELRNYLLPADWFASAWRE